jgi:hypothetical protein
MMLNSWLFLFVYAGQGAAIWVTLPVAGSMAMISVCPSGIPILWFAMVIVVIMRFSFGNQNALQILCS